MPITGSRLYVAAPPFTPLPFGLMSVVDSTPDADPHWKLGTQMQPDVCDDAGITLDECPTGTPLDKAATSDGLPTMAANPFTVYAWVDCSVPAFYDDAEQRVTAALTNGEARAVERGFWTGVAEGGGTIFPHLAEDTAVTEADGTILQLAVDVAVTGAPDLVTALGAVEQRLAECYGGVGVIHVTRGTLTHLAQDSLVERDGQRLRTRGGNLVAAGAGYPGTSPSGAAPAAGTTWLYATGAISLRRSMIRLTSTTAEAVDTAKNSMVLVAERTYVISWDCCLVGAVATL